MQIEIMKESVSYTDIIPWCFKARKSVIIGASEMAQKLKAPVASQSILMILVPEPHIRTEPTVRLSSALHIYTMVCAYAYTHTYICTYTYTLWCVHTHTHAHTRANCNVKFYYR